ncbi:N,N'-diacetylbacillosaminyl-diphospho-undecaprenol alpha-1,3-N-acetylgalactosaminyltransferase [Streptococcus infantarius subsp. infantarius]|nr:N,N'-diacetylbacillosaminyl-diphospho-undecaprenol alpha-1,3-N-acetylgalactosaminyltransferase [Streptococcus infantarius subsp. infantarius]
MRVVFVGQIKNRKTGLGKALNDIIDFTRSKINASNVREIDITNNFKFLVVILKILFEPVDVFYFTPAGSKFGIVRDNFYLILMLIRRKKVVCHFHNSSFGREIENNFFLGAFSSFVYKRVDSIIILGQKQKEMFRRFKLPDSKFSIIHNGIDEELFLNDEKIMSKHNHNHYNVIYFSNMLPEKGYRLILESADLLSDKADISFFFSGKFFDKRLEQEFLNRISTLKNVKYINGVYGYDKVKLLHKMNIFVLPSNYKDETLPISMLEAMASGCYIIVSDVGVINEVINPESTTLISKDNLNSKYISNAILEVLPKLPKLNYRVNELQKDFENQQVQARIYNLIFEGLI